MTIAGFHTVQETSDLVAVIDYRFIQVGKGFDSIPQAWTSQNQEAYAQLSTQWGILRARWAAHKLTIGAGLKIKRAMYPMVADSNIPAEDYWNEALKFVEGDAAQQPGEIRDIHTRVNAILTANGLPEIDLSNTPRFSDIDPDIAIYKKADKITKKVEAAGATATSTAFLIGGGAVLGILGWNYIKNQLK